VFGSFTSGEMATLFFDFQSSSDKELVSQPVPAKFMIVLQFNGAMRRQPTYGLTEF
tara:strand:- start:469 stop:636 length:168 start_codon:yes stop_codon:yes gene_type:complete